MCSTSGSCTHCSKDGAITLPDQAVTCMCSISPISPLSEKASGGSKGSRPWEGALFGATPSTAPAPETPLLQASPDLPPPPGLGEHSSLNLTSPISLKLVKQHMPGRPSVGRALLSSAEYASVLHIVSPCHRVSRHSRFWGAALLGVWQPHKGEVLASTNPKHTCTAISRRASHLANIC